MALFLAWVALSILVGILARRRGFDFDGFFFVSVFLSPLIGLIWLLLWKQDAKTDKD